MNILSLQSWVAYGHVGNAAAMFPLQRLGAEVWAVHTVQFSNHPGHGGFTGEVFAGSHIAALIEGIAARGVLGGCDAVLSGYMGDLATGHAILGAVTRARAANPRTLYCCDPVIGDDGPGVYVRPGIAQLMQADAVPAADLLTPNRFELAHLTGLPCTTLAEAKFAIAALQARMRPAGPRAVLLSSFVAEDTPDDAIDLLVAAPGACHRLRTPRLDRGFNGAGDALAALFLFHFLGTRSAVAALEAAASAVHAILRRTAADGARELALIAAQDELGNPSVRFRAAVA